MQSADTLTTQKSLCTLRTTNIFTEYLHTNTLTFLVDTPSRHVSVDVYLHVLFVYENVLGPPEYKSSHRVRQATFASLCTIRLVCD